MQLPLYRGLNAPDRPQSGMHLGLWFERYYSGYAPDFAEVDKDARSTWVKDLSRKEYGEKKRLEEKALHLRLLACSQSGDARILRCDSPFVTGLGKPHPLENGFLWHPTLGMPYLPGSAVKGLLRALLETAYEGSDKAAVLLRWFGTVKKDGVAEQAGRFVFLDALPVKPCELHVEVMTPHMGKWYEKGQKDPLNADTMPGDWHSPVPVQYLVAHDLSLQFVVLPRPGVDAGEMGDLWHALETALDWLGAGAKTALGFGRFVPDKDAERQLAHKAAEKQRELQQQARRDQASPEEQKIIDLEQDLAGVPKGSKPGTGDYLKAIEKIDQAITALLESGTPEERQRLHECIKKGMADQGLSVSKAKEKDFKKRLNSLLG